MKIGFIVNPIAGMGGKVGLKGTDGAEILKKAIELGAYPEAPEKAKKALKVLEPIKNKMKFITCPGDMGENQVSELGFKYELIGDKKDKVGPKDTELAASQMLDMNIDLLLFAGGDGTARNIYNAIGDKLPVIGIPAGVKIHSAVYANHPRSAGEIALKYLKGESVIIKEAEVMDIDEDAYRRGHITAKLYGYMKVLYERQLVQTLKSAKPELEDSALDGIAERIILEMEDDVYYIIGSGTSIRPIMDRLNLDNTLLGIDILKNKELLISDATEKEILETIDKGRAKIIVTVIGGQGYIFGRGNQQISGNVIRKVGIENIQIIATKNKLVSLGSQPILVDTGDDEVNNLFNRYMRVRTSYNEEGIYKVKGLV